MTSLKRHQGKTILVAVLVVLAAAVVSVVGTSTRTARATGIPPTDTLFYSGLLHDVSTGKPAVGSPSVAVDLYAAQTGGTAVCYTAAKAVTLTDGRFRVALDPQCVAAVQQNPDLWVEVVLNGTALPRSKIGAVPYAVEPKEAAKWDTAYGWGDHASAGYLTSSSPAGSVTSTKMSNWDAAYGWGSHASAGYLKTETDPTYSASAAAGVTSTKMNNWDAAYGWGNHASAGYLTTYLETDPEVGSNTTNYVSKWNGTALVSGSIFDNGKVGIGTTNPQGHLDVEDAISARIRVTNTGASFSYFDQNDNGGVVDLNDSTGTSKARILSYGDTYFNGGNVGIGTTGPAARLQINNKASSTISALRLQEDSPAAHGDVLKVEFYGDDPLSGAMREFARIQAHNDGSGSWAGQMSLWTQTYAGSIAERMRIDSGGYVGIGTASPSSTLHVSGGCITGTMCSDRRLKKNIRPVGSDTTMLEKVSKLEAVKYQWQNGDDDKTYLGLVAQDVERVLPEVVSTPADGSAGMGLSCNGLNAATIEAVKELKRLVETQQQQIASLRERVRRLDRR